MLLFVADRPSSLFSLAGDFHIFQKNPRVRKIYCPQFWGRKWLRQFYGRLEKCVLSAGKTHAHKIPWFIRGGGILGFLGGGGSADLIFMGARIFLNVSVSKDFPPQGSLYWLGRVHELPRLSDALLGPQGQERVYFPYIRGLV